MGQHDDYGKDVLRRATSGNLDQYGSSVEVDYGTGHSARIDGTVGSFIAVEIESRVSKQVRGAILDLICHPYRKKLLLLLPVHMSNPNVTAQQCNNILARFCAKDDFRVIVLKGSGDDPQYHRDKDIVAQALNELGFIEGVERRRDTPRT